MAQQIKLRFRPDQFRSSLEAMVHGEAGDGSAGTVVLHAQAITWDDAELVNINQAVPGDPDTERYINVCYQGPVQLDVPALAAMTNAARNAAMDAALAQWGTANYGLIQAMAKITRRAIRANPAALVAPV